MEPALSPMMQALQAAVTRLLGAKPPRVAAVQMGRGIRTPIERTTGATPEARRRARADGLSSLLYDPYESGRAQRYVDVAEMADEVPELDRALTVKRDFVFGGGVDRQDMATYDLGFGASARPEVRRIVEEAESALDLHRLVPEIWHEGHWKGDSGTELLYDDDGMAGERYIPPQEFRVEEEDGYVARYWHTPSSFGSDARQLHPFQFLHFAPNKRRGSRYGRSDWASARGVRRSHEAVESVLVMLALRRMVGDERIFWPFGSQVTPDKMWAYVRDLQAEMEDFYFDTTGELKKRVAAQMETVPRIFPINMPHDGAPLMPTVTHSPPANLEQGLKVVQHFQERFFIASGVPAALVGLERNVNARGTLVEQGIHFAITVRQGQKEAAAILVDILTRACLAAGVVPRPDEFAVAMFPPSQLDERMRAETAEIRSRAVKSLVESGVPLRNALTEAYAMSEEKADAIDLAALPGVQNGEVTPAAEAVLRSVLDHSRRLVSLHGPVAMDGASRLLRHGNVRPALLPLNRPRSLAAPTRPGTR